MDGSLAVKKLPVAHLRVRRSISGEECPPVCVEHLCNEAYSPVSLDTTQRTKEANVQTICVPVTYRIPGTWYRLVNLVARYANCNTAIIHIGALRSWPVKVTSATANSRSASRRRNDPRLLCDLRTESCWNIFSRIQSSGHKVDEDRYSFG